MRGAVFCRYWSTGGGAEKYGGAIAQHLARSGDVDLLTFEPVDLTWLAERLHLDLGAVTVRVLEDRPGAVPDASADYDVFVNVSFMSADRAAHHRSVYVVHFPTSVDGHIAPWKRAVLARSGWLRPRSVRLDWGPGFHHADAGGRGVTWTSERAVLRVTTDPGLSVPVELRLGHQRPAALGTCHVVVEADGEEVAAIELARPEGRVAARSGTPVRFLVRSPAPGVPVEVAIRTSETFVPADVLGTSDRRVLGVPLRSVRLGRGPRARLASVFPVLAMQLPSLDWIDSYGVVVSNSEFTRGWVQEYWGVDTEVLHPPVTMQPAGDKEPIVLNVGRFFAADQGHSKKQLELVRAFRRLCDEGERGWTLHLVGGCAPDGEAYLAQVRAAADGYPVVLHVNAPGSELRDLYGRASIYWHASGLGEDERRHPDRLEHFGITTVEAMSAGAVPVVIARAGLRETVRHGVDGYHFETVPELVALTRTLIDDPGARARMSASSARRAERFSIEAFEARLDGILDRLQEPSVR